MKVLIFDSNYLLHRTLLANPGLANLRNSSGTETGGVFGFIRTLRASIDYFNCNAVISVWDHGYSKRRKDLYQEYKSGRVASTEEDKKYRELFSRQREILWKLLPSLGIKIFFIENREADDCIYRITRNQTNEWIICSDDYDMFQCICKNVSVWRPLADSRGSEGYITIDNFSKVTGIRDSAMYLFAKVLTGDGSDKVPGIAKGIGWKTATTIVNSMKEPTVEALINVCREFPTSNKHNAILKNLSAVYRNIELLDLSKEIFSDSETLRIVNVMNDKPSLNELRAMDHFAQLEFKSITDNFSSWIFPFRKI